jgi:hypothetical protein
MSFSASLSSSRREFFRDLARYGSAAILAAMASLIGAKRPIRAQSCVNRGVCVGCEEFDNCGLPPALSARLAKPQSGREALKQKS